MRRAGERARGALAAVRRSANRAGPGPAPEPAGSRALLDVSGVDAGYGPIQVLFGASIAVHAGERVALLGTNGAGKSTLLRAIAGAMGTTAGTVRFGGEDITHASQQHRAERGLVYIAGGRATFPGLTVLENLKVSTYHVRHDRDEVASRIDEALELFPRLRERSDQRAGTLSGGEQQMVAIGRALVARPELLMIDELSLGLAPILLQEIEGMILELAGRGMTMLVVEQSLTLAAAIAERAYFMEKGEIRFEGSIGDLVTRGDLARSVFLGADRDVAAGRAGR